MFMVIRLLNQLKFCVFSLFLCLSYAQQSLADDNSPGYQLGQGYALGQSGFRLGGYSSIHAQGLGYASGSINLNSLSLFFSWDNGGKLRFFSETEGDNLLDISGKPRFSSIKSFVDIQRIYFDYLVNDSLTVRVGKFLTPIGQWNLIHVDPLVWTVTRPVATSNLFSDYATGLMFQGTLLLAGNPLDYSVYSDYSSVLDPTPINEVAFDNAQGVRLRYHLTDSLQIGVSYADFALTDNNAIRNHLVGFDLAWAYQRFAVNSEIVLRSSDAKKYNDSDSFLIFQNVTPVKQNGWQGYVQGVPPLTEKLYAVSRYEFFDWYRESFYNGQGHALVFGLNYRLQNPLVFKLEYRTGKNNSELAPDGLFGSFSVLF